MCSSRDGDQLTLLAIKNPKFHKLFMTMCPTYTFIDRANGRFNRAMSYNKDYAAIISAAWDIDRIYDNFLNSPEEDSYTVMAELGLDNNQDVDNDRIAKLYDALNKNGISCAFNKRYQNISYLDT